MSSVKCMIGFEMKIFCCSQGDSQTLNLHLVKLQQIWVRYGCVIRTLNLSPLCSARTVVSCAWVLLVGLATCMRTFCPEVSEAAHVSTCCQCYNSGMLIMLSVSPCWFVVSWPNTFGRAAHLPYIMIISPMPSLSSVDSKKSQRASAMLVVGCMHTIIRSSSFGLSFGLSAL